MILRHWRGWTTPANAGAYDAIVREVLASIAARQIAGYQGAYLIRRTLGDEVEFAALLKFESLESLREYGDAFAGGDYEMAYVPARAREVLTRFDERSAHFEVLLSPDQTR
jgi:hypothetical protein